jgi:ubiquinone biosynthesis protein
MPSWLIFAIVALAFSVVATWVVRRLLDVEVGWLRAWVTAIVVFAIGVPVAAWSLDKAGVYQDGQFTASGSITIAFVALTVGWLLAAVVIAVLSLEFLWPSRRWRNPIAVVRDAIRRRDRARRYVQILTIGSRHGLTFYESRRHGEGEEDELPTALVSAMNEAGVTFVKLGQVLSSREDVLPPAFIEAFSTLQMDSSPIPWAEAEAAITAQLGRPIADVFADIDQTPLAAASVAQVHAARLMSGEEVVVKIQRPRARAQVTTDLDILERLANEAEKRTEWAKAYGARALVAEFSRALREELDYRIEVANTEMLRAAIAASGAQTWLHLPTVHKEYSTAQMIVQERVYGTPFGKLAPGALPPNEAKQVADALLDAVFDQIAVRGIFHADLHAGNVVLGEDRSVTLIDFGSVGVLERSMRRLLLPLLIGMANEDDVAVTDAALLICGPPAGDFGSTTFNAVDLQRDIGVILTRVHNSRADENIFRLFVDVLRRNRMALPPSLLLVFRTLASLEGTLRRLVPDYDMVARALEIAPRMALSLVTPRGALLTAQTWSALLTEQARRLPRRIESLTRSLDEGTLELRLRVFESENERTWVDSIMGRITTTVVGITLVIAGIMLGVDDGGPMVTGDVPAFSFLGAVVGLGGLLLLMRSLRTALRRR